MPPQEGAQNSAFEPEQDASPPSTTESTDITSKVPDPAPEGTDPASEITDPDQNAAAEKPDPMELEDAQGRVHTSFGKFERRERWKILKNVIAISFAFMCLFTSFQGISNLQSSINTEGGERLS